MWGAPFGTRLLNASLQVDILNTPFLLLARNASPQRKIRKFVNSISSIFSVIKRLSWMGCHHKLVLLVNTYCGPQFGLSRRAGYNAKSNSLTHKTNNPELLNIGRM